MAVETLRLDVGADGIAVITIDLPNRTMNVVTPEFQREFGEVVEQVFADAGICGAIITSGKPGSFIAGADINVLIELFDSGVSAKQGADLSRAFSKQLRRLETGGKPIACAMNGLALGGGFELALACHSRILADDGSVGLPEVSIGLLPGAGGTQRLPRLVGIERAQPLLLSGKPLRAAEALKLGIVDALAPENEVVDKARAWLLTRPRSTQPWDEKGYTIPGGAGPQAAHAARTFTAGTSLTAQNTQRNYPAPLAILSCLFEGTQLEIDVGLAIESKYFGQLLAGSVARNMVRTLFIHKGAADKLSSRPRHIAKTHVRKLGVLGAGMMGAGIAYVSSKVGMQVVLLDSSLELAEKGRQHSAKLEEKRLARGEVTQPQVGAILARIQPTTDYADLADCDLVIEAVFERRAVKLEVIGKAGEAISGEALFASNTSTLPISELAQGFPRATDFIGLHFFSPVDKMPLVEVIVGRQTSPLALARALDFVGQLKKTPIVVNDSPGFYTSRVFGAYFQEGLLMLSAGVMPALIENSARAAGMPVGPLAICDEVSLDLQLKVIEQNVADGQMQSQQLPEVISVLRKMVIECNRRGRRGGAGFYDYLPDGKKQLWTQLAMLFPLAAEQPTAESLRQRLLYVQALEAVRCFESHVVTRAEDADLGSILGVGFPSWTGGTLSFIDMVGTAAFVAECERLAGQYGPRFAPPMSLREKAARGEGFFVSMAATG
jgi:3-hydroxyacyl-CoA dehydrogenase / enoyl-CoA hydratase / 3-hydroxybutyryl-CoA epimerase